MPLDRVSPADPDLELAKDPNLIDYRAALEAFSRGDLKQYRGQHVAFLEGQMVGAHLDGEALRQEVARQFGIDPERPAVLYVFTSNDVLTVSR